MKQEDQYSIINNNNNNNFHHTYHQEQQLLLQQQIMMQQQQQQQSMMFPSSISSSEQVISSSPWSIPQYPSSNNFNNHHHPFLQPSSNSPYASFFNNNNNNNNRRVVVPSMHQFASPSSYEGPSNDHLRIISETLHHHHHHHHQGVGPFGLQAEIGKMTAQEIMEAKALAASKSHSEAERRRRERINNHLAKLRSLLPSTTKTDKASLLAEVIEHVKELKRQTSVIAETSPVPTESDELTVDATDDEEGKFVIKASLCCEDRSDLLPELIKTLKSLRLRTLKADITTLGGRVKNVLFITSEDHQQQYYSSSSTTCTTNNNNNTVIDDDGNNNNHHHYQQQQYCISSIQEALRAVMEKSSVGNSNESASSTVKRQRTNMISIS